MKKNKAIQGWVQYAREDLSSALFLDKHKKSEINIIFLCHESVEKYLKALIQFQNNDFPYTHNLDTLIGSLEIIDKDKTKLLNIAITLDELYPIARYPGKERITQKDVKSTIKVAQEAEKIILKYL